MLRKSTLVGIGIALIGGGIGLSIIGITLGGHMGTSFGPTGIEFGPSIKETSSSIAGSRQIVEQTTLPSFTKMDLEIGIAEVELLLGDDYSIAINMDKDIPIDYELKGDTLVVRQEDDRKWGINIGVINARNGLVVITVPGQVVLEESSIKTGVGDWTINGLEMESLKMDIGVGDMKIENVRAKKMNVTGGVGDTEIYDVNTEGFILHGGVGDIIAKAVISNEVELTAGVGSIDIEGEFEGDIEIEGGVGDIQFMTTLGEQSYNYDITKGVGTTRINDKKVGDLDNYRQDNGASYTFEVKSGLGDIKIYTSK